MQSLYAQLKALVFYPLYLVIGAADFLATIVRYYPNARFRRADWRCLRAYLVRDPYTICRRYLRDFPDDEVQKIYGETFFGTLEKIAEAVGLAENDVVYDLGCGRGRGVFWFNAFYGCRAVGVEINPLFVIEARTIARKAGIDGVAFELANLLDLDCRDATVIYLYGSAFSDEAIEKLVDRFRALRRGTRVVSVSYALNDYAKTPLFELKKTFKGRYLWGYADIYVQHKL